MPHLHKALTLAATFMKHFNISIIFFLTSFASFGQDNQKDTFLTRLHSNSILSQDKDFLKSSVSAKKYVSSLVGKAFYNDHIKINFKQTRKDSFEVYVGESGNAKLIESHTYFNIHYYLVDKNDTLSYFNLLVDSLGIPTQYDKDFSFSSPTKLLLYFKNLFPNKFKIDFKKAVAIGKHHGFNTKPFLNYETLNKEGIYWSFSKKNLDGKRKLMNINARTGSIKEFYMPVLEE